MILADYHVHTTYCDGKNTPQEIIEQAIEKGVKKLGLCTHSYTFFDESYCIKKDRTQAFQLEVNELAKKYSDKINVSCGVEQDCLSTAPTKGFDYVIGSVHYVNINDKYFPIDESADKFNKLVSLQFGGDYYALAEKYYDTVKQLAKNTKPDFIGHFDLITKYNKEGCLFNENEDRYKDAWKSAIDYLLPHNIPFEINTGAISRGYKVNPYPNYEIIKYILENGGRVILSSDSHIANTLCFNFTETEKLITDMGYKEKLITL